MISCYNRGCGQDFDPANNPDGECESLMKKMLSINWVKNKCVHTYPLNDFVLNVVNCALRAQIERKHLGYVQHYLYTDRLFSNLQYGSWIEFPSLRICDFFQTFVLICLFWQMRVAIIRAYHSSMMRTRAGLVAIRKASISPNFWI